MPGILDADEVEIEVSYLIDGKRSTYGGVTFYKPDLWKFPEAVRAKFDVACAYITRRLDSEGLLANEGPPPASHFDFNEAVCKMLGLDVSRIASYTIRGDDQGVDVTVEYLPAIGAHELAANEVRQFTIVDPERAAANLAFQGLTESDAETLRVVEATIRKGARR